MSADPDRLARLLDAYRDGSINAEEATELAAALRAGDGVAELIFDRQLGQALDGTDADAVVQSFLARLQAEAAPLKISARSFPRTEFYRGSHRRMAFIGMATLAAAGLLFAWLVSITMHAGSDTTMGLTVADAGPEARISGNGTACAVTSGHRLHAGDLVQTGPERCLSLHADDGTRITLLPGTTLRLDDEVRGRLRFSLLRGRLAAHVAKQPGPMVFTTAQSMSEVLGTRLALTAAPDATILWVEDGAVRSTSLLAKDDAAVVSGGGMRRTIAEPLFASPSLCAAYQVIGRGPWRPYLGLETAPDLKLAREGFSLTDGGPITEACRQGGLTVEFWQTDNHPNPGRLTLSAPDATPVPLLPSGDTAHHVVLTISADGTVRRYADGRQIAGATAAAITTWTAPFALDLAPSCRGLSLSSRIWSEQEVRERWNRGRSLWSYDDRLPVVPAL